MLQCLWMPALCSGASVSYSAWEKTDAGVTERNRHGLHRISVIITSTLKWQSFPPAAVHSVLVPCERLSLPPPPRPALCCLPLTAGSPGRERKREHTQKEGSPRLERDSLTSSRASLSFSFSILSTSLSHRSLHSAPTPLMPHFFSRAAVFSSLINAFLTAAAHICWSFCSLYIHGFWACVVFPLCV